MHHDPAQMGSRSLVYPLRTLMTAMHLSLHHNKHELEQELLITPDIFIL